MADHTFFGKSKLCYTDVASFTDYQGIGNDPLYRRYDSVLSVIKVAVDEKYQHFLAAPLYLDDEDQICWYIDNWVETPIKLTDLSGKEHEKYQFIKDETIRHYRKAAAELSGEDLQILGSAIKYIDDERIYCSDGKVFLVAWGMTPDTKAHKVVGSVIHEYKFAKKFNLTFQPGEHGKLANKIYGTVIKKEGTPLECDDIPEIVCDDGWEFTGWLPSLSNYVVREDEIFTAQYKKKDIPLSPNPPNPPSPPSPVQEPTNQFFNCTFDPGKHGALEGNGSIRKMGGTTLDKNEIPIVKPHKGYRFTGWNTVPFGCLIDKNTVFVAQYEKNIPWYKRWWLWLVGSGCLKWLLWILIALFLLWLLLILLHSCRDCLGTNRQINGVVKVDTKTGSDGRVIDDNGVTRPVTGNDGQLPENDMVVAPVMGEGGEEPPIIKQPGRPNIIANRLFLFMENEDDDVTALARDFKKAYPEDEYGIIGYDKEVKLLVIQIPEEERDQIRESINGKIPNHKFIVFDEEIYELNTNGVSDSEPADRGWHLDAIHLKQGWEYTKGSSDIKVAIVDDGIQAAHPMFKGRIVDAYNVFTQNNALSVGEGHGTHTAGLAAGSSDFYEQGASGVAPGCKLMPIQVFDNKLCPLSALIAGVMYAVHHDADVVNISIGPSLRELNALPVSDQESIAATQFTNVASLWNRVCRLAAKKNCILVFAAGNDDILASIPPENRNEAAVVVTAVDSRMYPTVFTNYGTCSDISAPGKDIYSSFPVSGFRSFDGTSMAAPIAAGTIALMKSLKKDLTVTQARNALYNSGGDVYGWIPPMVLVDKVLDEVRNNKFDRTEREYHPVPDGVDIHLHSGRIPASGGDEDITQPLPAPGTPNGDVNYDAIYRQIEEYEHEIKEIKKMIEQLKGQLPKN